jgi:hypothetical protein
MNTSVLIIYGPDVSALLAAVLRGSLETVAGILTNFLKIGKDFRRTENKTAKNTNYTAFTSTE